MTLEALENAIIRLIKLRQNTEPTNYEEHKRINTKLDKLYDIKFVALKQAYNK